MSDEEQQASIKATVVRTSEPTFKPPPLVDIPSDEPLPQAGTTVDTVQAVKQIFAVLEPEEADQTTFFTPTYTDFYNSFILPPAVSYEAMPTFEAPKAELIINVETTTLLPWEGRIIVIGVLDPNAMAPETMNFVGETEADTVQQFIDFFVTSPYTTLVGYNVAFDYRFIYAALQKYRKTLAAWPWLKLYDLMQQQKQVKDSYVPGFNKPGTLEQWSTYLFGSVPYAPQKQVLKWFKAGNIDEIVNFNSDKLAKAYGLYVLNKVVDGSIPGAEVVGRPAQAQPETAPGTEPSNPVSEANVILVECPTCHDGQEMPKSAKVIKCRTCKTPIANPAL